MQRYLIKRLLIAIPTLIGITIVAFLLMYVLPGDPMAILMGDRLDEATVEMLRAKMGLDKPLHIQYQIFITSALKGDLGVSYQTRQPVTAMLKSALTATFKVSVLAYAIAVVLGIPAGVFAAVRHNTWGDLASVFVSLLGICIPSFVVGLLLLYIFGYLLRCLPLGGYGGWSYMILPAVTLGVRPAAMLARITRSGMLEVLRQDYVRTARAKGLKDYLVIGKHALRNCLIPVVTVMGGQFSSLLAGSVVTETIFSWPGIGRMAVQAIQARDFPVVRGVVLVSACIVVFINLIIDLSYGFLDPRIRYN